MLVYRLLSVHNNWLSYISIVHAGGDGCQVGYVFIRVEISKLAFLPLVVCISLGKV